MPVSLIILIRGNIVAGDKSENELTVLALQQVLVKVSGNPKIVELNGSKRLLTQTQQLLSQYGYQSIFGKRYFTAVFDKRKIQPGTAGNAAAGFGGIPGRQPWSG